MRDAQIPIEVLKKYLDLFDKGDNTKEDRMKLLDEQRMVLENKIEKMKEAHEKLVYKLKLYQDDSLDRLLKNENSE